MYSILYIFATISAAWGAGEFSILHHPSGMFFRSHDHLRESVLTEVYSASLGFSTGEYSNWQGIYIDAPFDLAESIMTVSVDGVADISLQKGHHFPLKTDTTEKKIYHALANRVLMHYPEGHSKLIRIDLSNGIEEVQKHSIFKDIHTANSKYVTPKSLSISIDEDRKFLEEVGLLYAISDKVEEGVVKSDNVPDLYWFHFTALHALSDFHGENATETMEAKLILNEAILRLNAVFKKAYKGAVLTNVITSDVAHTRRGRSILQASDSDNKDQKSDKEKYNLASYYNKDYPAVFNIILWFGVLMVFSLLAICYAIGDMDPGRDSIIYRMTSTRMKKDN